MKEHRWIPSPIAAELDEIRHSSWRDLGPGISLMVIGAASIVAASAATFATVLVFGWLLLLAAAISLLQAFQFRTGSSFFLHLMSVLLRGVTGFMLIRYPLSGAMSLTLAVASLFLVGGMFRAVGSSALQFPRWGWRALSGFISLALGIVLLLHLPVSSTGFIGFAIGVDLIVDGVGLTAVGLAVQRIPNGRTLTGL